MRCDLCLCSEIEKIDGETRVAVVMHWSELQRTTNTARLIPLTLTNSRIHLVGRKGEDHRLSESLSADRITLVLFPEPSAAVLNEEFIEKINLSDQSLKRGFTLVVPDGTWSQARKIAHRMPELHGVKRVRLAAGPPSRYTLRRRQVESGLCTIEAVARAVGIIDGPVQQLALEESLETMLERVSRSRQ